jgi:hypothetical protein
MQDFSIITDNIVKETKGIKNERKNTIPPSGDE